MNSSVIVNILRFFLLILVQVTIFNKINLFGYINPFPYLLFIILYPVNGNKSALIFFSFLMGLIIDMFMNSGGVHAAASVCIAFFRPNFFRFAFGLSYEYQTIKISGKLTSERFSFILISVVTHHLILFLLEIFRLSFITQIVSRTIFSTIFTLVTCLIFLYLFKPSKR
jgi:rod shape-determining protein MreD